MCFSAEADFVSGAIIGAIGVATLSQVETPRQAPLAALRLAFAQPVTEGFVWHDPDDALRTPAGRRCTSTLFAWVLIPSWCRSSCCSNRTAARPRPAGLVVWRDLRCICRRRTLGRRVARRDTSCGTAAGRYADAPAL